MTENNSSRKADFAETTSIPEPSWKALQSQSMWDEQDYFSRWVQAVFAVLLALSPVCGIYMTMYATLTILTFGGIGRDF